MKLHYIKGMENWSDLQVAVFKRTKWLKKKDTYGKWTQRRVLCIIQVFLRYWTAFNNGF